MSSPTTEQEETLSRAGMYTLFSSVLLREFDKPTLETFRESDWSSALASLKVEVPTVTESLLEELAIDYCRIFVGPKDFCPPYQSVWESGQFQGQVVDSMNEFLGVVQTETPPAIKDHAGFQFEVMAIILQFQADNPESVVGLAEAFFSLHIAWTVRMFARAAALAETELYKSLLLAGVEFIESEQERLVPSDSVSKQER